MNIPNKLSLLRCALIPVFMACMLIRFQYHYAAALLVFVLASLTDWLDGHLARKNGLVTNLGKFLDPLADKALTTTAFICFVEVINSRSMPWALMLILTREFMVTSVRLLAAKDGTVIAASFFGKLKTVAQFIAIIYTLVALEFATWQGSVLAALSLPSAVYTVPLLIGRVLIWVSVALTAASGVEYVWANRRFFLGEK